LCAAAALVLKADNVLFDLFTPLKLAIFLGNASCEAVLRAHGAPE
jgi:hypothetical protein